MKVAGIYLDPKKAKAKKSKNSNSREASRILSNSYHQEEQENRNDITDPYPDIEIDDLDPVQGYSRDYINNLENEARILSGQQNVKPNLNANSKTQAQENDRYSEEPQNRERQIYHEEIPSPRPMPEDQTQNDESFDNGEKFDEPMENPEVERGEAGIHIQEVEVGQPEQPLTFGARDGELLKSDSFEASDPYNNVGSGGDLNLDTGVNVQAKLAEIDKEQIITDRVSDNNSENELANNLEEDVNEISKISKPDDMGIVGDNTNELADIENSQELPDKDLAKGDGFDINESNARNDQLIKELGTEHDNMLEVV